MKIDERYIKLSIPTSNIIQLITIQKIIIYFLKQFTKNYSHSSSKCEKLG